LLTEAHPSLILEEMMLQELQELDIDETDDDDVMDDAFDQSFTDSEDPCTMQELTVFKVNYVVIACNKKSRS